MQDQLRRELVGNPEGVCSTMGAAGHAGRFATEGVLISLITTTTRRAEVVKKVGANV